jgi:hydrogenase-4 membrane subunit HyfE
VTSLLIGLLAVLLLPLFVSTWRTSLLGLACQGLTMAWIAYRLEGHLSVDSALTFFDLIVVRGLAAPLALYAVMRTQNAPRRNDVIPPNMLSWTVAIGLVLLAFRFAGILVPEEGDAQTLVAVSASGLLLGFLVLATQSAPFSQMVGALRIENAIALFELGGVHDHHESPLLRAGQISVVIISVALYRWYLATLSSGEDATDAQERPSL